MHQFNYAKLGRANSQPCFVKFEQPLSCKSSKMTNTSSDSFFNDTTIIAGTFYTIINLLGCIKCCGAHKLNCIFESYSSTFGI